MPIIRFRKYVYAGVGLITALALGALLAFGLTLSIEFTGGALVEVSYEGGRPEKDVVAEALEPLSLGEYSLRAAGEDSYLLRTKEVGQEKQGEIITALSLGGSHPATVVRSATVGPTIGDELASKAWVAIGLVVLVIILYITFVFRGVAKPVASWMYGLVTVLVLLHDLLIPIGLFATLGYFVGAEVDVLFVVAVLTILGYSVNDTIVVFDRVRENLKKNEEAGIQEPFDELVGGALRQTIARSINTSVTTFLGVLALLVFGGEVTRYFALTLLTGVVAGTYSSILFASPLLVTIEAWQKKRAAGRESPPATPKKR